MVCTQITNPGLCQYIIHKIPNLAAIKFKVLTSTLFFILVKDMCSKDSTDEKLQTEILNIDPGEVTEYKLTGTRDSKVFVFILIF